ncbi:DUF4270 domain-containing protein [Parabacteroides sp. OttesenSCG-928-G07]|nr:DUF4270 domain-containing protein [Parabacteroides sp. OttesenSCG-928-G07]
MKLQLSILGLVLGLFILSGCKDELNLVGPSIQPGEDKMTVFTDTFRMEASTVLMDAVYARSSVGLLGEIYDPLYGNLKTDYICQFYCPEGYKFSNEPLNGVIDSVSLDIMYSSWVGDSLAPMRAKVYMITEPLKRNYYSDMKPEDYCDMQNVMASQSYSAFDRSVPDSVRNSAYGFIPTVNFKFDKVFGQRFYDETINNPSTFANQESFNEFLPGFYITTDFGSGNIIDVLKTYITFYFKQNITGSEGQDSIVVRSEMLHTTKEIIQLHRYQNTDITHLLEPNDLYTYIKSPAGVTTKLVIPSSKIASIVDGHILNDLQLSLTAYPQEEWDYAFTPPSNLLLIPEDSVKVFFEEDRAEDNKTTFIASRSSYTYNFGNISNILKNQLANAPEKDLHLLIIPVNYTTETVSNIIYTDVSHYLSPSGVKIRIEEDKLDFTVVSSKYNK